MNALALLLILAAMADIRVASCDARTVMSLDGQWQIAQGEMEVMPARFDRQVSVPGLADMAQPPFTEVGVASKQRKAFWYRRTFVVKGPRRAVALLKIAKAQFRTKAWLNGVEAGEHIGCFTPGYFDVSRILRYGSSNTLVVRLGASREAMPEWAPAGTDQEKSRWIPGIYDSVSLILTQSPYIVSTQVAPKLATGSILVQTALRNTGSAPVRTRLHFIVRERLSGRAASLPQSGTVTVPPNGETVFTASVKLLRTHLWSPEDPFLYVVRCEAGTDSVETRFGMREFRYDTTTGRAMLNGRPYFLRGTNFCMFRFFEDPLRGSLPWDRSWVRRLLELPRGQLGWNSARVCIAPFPQFWYDIADETGWLLQNEFPVWGFNEKWSREELVREYREWLQESWNHPSIVVWDACNETLTPRTGDVIREVRTLDLSGRPWDDGYSAPNRAGDAVEDHPYKFSDASFRLSGLGSTARSPQGLRKPPVVINEYDWLWVNRDGSPTSLTQKVYSNNLGYRATPDQRFEFCAYNNAALTEYWRATRLAAGVQHFCYLTYSRPGGQTSDNFVDIRRLKLEPHFLQYMRDAFAPSGVMIDDFTDRLPPGSNREYRIIVTNDLYDAKAGIVRLSLLDIKGSKQIWERRAPFTVSSLGQAVVTIPAVLPSIPGQYRLAADLMVAGQSPTRSRRNIEVVTAAEARKLVNLAHGCVATASSEINDSQGDCRAQFATDGRLDTRWSSQFADPQWISVDLRTVKRISRVSLSWEAAYGKAFRIQTSLDGRDWKDACTVTNGRGGREDLRFSPVEARFIRMLGERRATAFGYSIWEMQVFEE